MGSIAHSQTTVPPADLDEASIETLVRAFYERVRSDARLGPIFSQAIGTDWEPHLQKMFAFWSSVMLMSGRYKGQPVPTHKRLAAIRPEDFILWLDIFRRTARDTCDPRTAELFIDKAERIARSLQMAMFFNPAEIVS